MRLAWVVSAIVLAAGCLGPAADRKEPDPYRNYTTISPPIDAEGVQVREPDCSGGECKEYFFVHLWGSENLTQIRGTPAQHGTCTRPWRFDADLGARSVTYNATEYQDRIDKRNLKAIFAENVMGVTVYGRRYVDGCPTVYALHPAYPTNQHPYPTRTALMPNYGGAVKLTVYRDGSMAFGYGNNNLTIVDLGKKVVVSYGRLIAGADATFYVKGGFEVVNRGPWPLTQLVAGSASGATGPG